MNGDYPESMRSGSRQAPDAAKPRTRAKNGSLTSLVEAKTRSTARISQGRGGVVFAEAARNPPSTRRKHRFQACAVRIHARWRRADRVDGPHWRNEMARTERGRKWRLPPDPAKVQAFQRDAFFNRASENHEHSQNIAADCKTHLSADQRGSETKNAAQAGTLSGGISVGEPAKVSRTDFYHAPNPVAKQGGGSSIVVSSALLNSPLMRRAARDPGLVAGYASGDIATQPARHVAIKAAVRYGGRFARPRPQRSPDREKSIRRRRTLAATWCLPPSMASQLTTCEQAYARIVSDEVQRHGKCDLTLDEIAARGGMCRKTAKRSQDRVKGLGWISVEHRPVSGRKHLSNVIRVVSAEWLMWIEMGPRPRRTGGHSCPTTVNQSFHPLSIPRFERPKGALEKVQMASTEPLGRDGGALGR